MIMKLVFHLLTFIPARLKNELALSLFRTLIARGLAALGSLALLVVLGRLYGAPGVGIFALAQGFILGAGILARYGMDQALMRFVGRDNQTPQIMNYLRWACTKTLWFSTTVAIVIFACRDLFERAFNAHGLANVLVGIAIATPAFTLGFLLSGFFKGVRKPATACLLENGSVSLVTGLLVLVFHWLAPDAGFVTIGWTYALAAWLVLLKGAWQLRNWYKQQKWQLDELQSIVTHQEFATSSRAFFVMSLAGFMQTVLSIMIAGWLLSSADLGLFKTAQQTAVLISFILIVINAIFPPRFAHLFHQDNHQALERLARQGALLGILLASPLLLICLLLPHWVLGLVGSEFVQAAPLLQIIATGQLVNVATGSVSYLLNMTGHEKLMRNIALLSNVLGILFFFLLIPLFGALGAALSLTLVLMLQNLIGLVFVWHKLGIWMLPTPNVLKMIGIPSER